MINQLFVVIALLISVVAAQQGWRAGVTINTAYGVAVGSTPNEVYVAQQNSTGSYLFYSGDRGNANTGKASSIKLGNRPLSVASTRDGQFVCIIGLSGLDHTCYNFQTGGTASVAYAAISQNLEPFGQSGVAAVGQLFSSPQSRTAINGVSVSDDCNRFTLYDIGLPASSGYRARYGAFPTATTWYITSGSFPAYSGKWDDQYLRLSQRIRILQPQIGIESKPDIKFFSANLQQPGFVGAISKTVDGGQTWTKVFDSQGLYYFNQISCVDDRNCFAVGENARMAVVLKTSNGGESWAPVLTLRGPYSLNAVNMISNSEIFVSGGTVSTGPNKELVGLYYRSTDGGATWTKNSFNGYGWDMDFKDGYGYAIALFKDHTDVLSWA